MTQTPPQQYCLRWNNYQNNLTNVFDQLLQSEAFVDVTLACDGNSIKAHKMVLSACSPFFQTLFFDNPCSHPIVILKDISWDELKAVVEFMYRGEINVSQEQLAPLLKVAEMLKIRGLADVSRGSTGVNGQNEGSRGDSHARNTSDGGSPSGTSGLHRNLPNPADFMSTSNQGSEPGSPVHSNGLLNHPLLQGHHLSPLNSLLNSNDRSSTTSTATTAHAQAMATLHRRKRRKMSTPERTPSPPEDDLDDHTSNQLEIDSQNGDWNNDHSSPRSMTADRASSSGEPSTNNLGGGNGPSGGISMSPSSTPTPGSMPSLSAAAAAAATVGMSLAGGSSFGSTTASSLVGGPLGPAFLNLHAAAAAAAAIANANSSAGGSGSVGGNGGNNPPSTSSSLTSDLDLKPGIVEMIREEERAKMLESSHGWLGPTTQASLTDTYQYQIQNLWQKCWNQNQGGVSHALRFRERGPLKSWRPETMAEAIFAVLKDGLSLSQAARLYEIPYPTFVLYANRVHNMLGPSSDGCSGSDLMSDMRPKGRGRPQRILLGSWPEEHIRGVIRAVVFRDTPGGKDDFPFIFNRETGLCIPQSLGSSSSQNGLDMTLNKFTNSFLNAASGGGGGTSSASGGNNLLHPQPLQPPQSTTPHQQTAASSSSATLLSGDSDSVGAKQSATNLPSLAGNRSSSTSRSSSLHDVLDINGHCGKGGNGGSMSAAVAAASATAAALQHLQQLQQQGTLSASATPALGAGSPSSTSSNSPLQQVLSGVGLLSAQAQRELLALQQRQLQQHQRRLSMSGSGEPRDDPGSPMGLLNKKSPSTDEVTSAEASSSLALESEILQIKAQLGSPLASLIGAASDDKADESGSQDLVGNRREVDYLDCDNQHIADGNADVDLYSADLKPSLTDHGQSSFAGSSGCGRDQENPPSGASSAAEEQKMRLEADFATMIKNAASEVHISGNSGSKSLKTSRGENKGNGNTISNSNSNNASPKGNNGSSFSSNIFTENSGRDNDSSINNNASIASTGTGQDDKDDKVTTMTGLLEATSRRASLRGSTFVNSDSITEGSGGGYTGIGGSTASGVASSSTLGRVRGSSNRTGERDVKAASPLNFHQASSS